MTMALNLVEAASLSYDQCAIHWYNNALKAQFLAFVAAAEPIFLDPIPNDRPVGNWLIPMQAVAAVPTVGQPDIVGFNERVEYLYRICLAGQSQFDNGALISAAQRDALLAAWNTTIGT